MMRRVFALALGGVLMCLFVHAMADQVFAQLTPRRHIARFIPIRPPLESGFTSLTTVGDSEDGWVMTGHGTTADGEVPFAWRERVIYPLNGLPSGATGTGRAAGWRGFQENGQTVYKMAVVGVLNNSSGGQAFLWVYDEGFQSLPGLDGVRSEANGMSLSGPMIAGQRQTSRGLEAYYWTADGGVVDLGDLDGGTVESKAWSVAQDNGAIVGEAQSAQGTQAFLWTPGGDMSGLGDLSGGAYYSSARAVAKPENSAVQAVVGVGTSARGQEAFRWTQSGGMQGLGDLAGGAYASVARDVDETGTYVVGSSNTDQGETAFVWDSVYGMRDLRALVADEFGLETDLAGWTLDAATSIATNLTVEDRNDILMIAGSGVDPEGTHCSWRITFTPRDDVVTPRQITAARYLLLH